MNVSQPNFSAAQASDERPSHADGALWTTVHAPARVNLLGEHTDYTGGLVLPIAIPFVTRVAIAQRNDGHYVFFSDRFSEVRRIARDDRSSGRGDWSDYPVGVLRELQKRRIVPPAFEMHVSGDVPFGAGLSSSASVEVASLLAMLALSRKRMEAREIALLCREAENNFVHSPCGIMDQFVIVAAKAGAAMMLDTRSLAYEHLPLDQGAFAETRIVVCNSMVKHSVASGEYGVRRLEVEAGQAVLVSANLALRDLGDATLDQLESLKDAMPYLSYLRCRHIVSENARVRQSRTAMLAGDPKAFGRLMLEAHASQRDDFECSCAEVDFLVDTAGSHNGCFGARLTGGGFGGCIVNLVDRVQVETFISELRRAYRQRFEIDAEIYVCDAVDGAIACAAATSETGGTEV